MQKARKSHTKRKPRNPRNPDTETTIVKSVKSTGSVFPITWRRTLRYVEAVQLTSTVGSVASYQWRANACFDPNYTGSGHQPRYFDQLCSSTGPYLKYRVLGGRVTLEMHGDNGSSSTFVSAGFSDLSTLPSDYTAGELPGWRTVISPKTFAFPRKLIFAYRVADIESVSESAVLSEDNYAASYNAAPADPVFFSVICQENPGGTSNTEFVMTMEMDVQFEEPILIAQS